MLLPSILTKENLAGRIMEGARDDHSGLMRPLKITCAVSALISLVSLNRCSNMNVPQHTEKHESVLQNLLRSETHYKWFVSKV